MCTPRNFHSLSTGSLERGAGGTGDTPSVHLEEQGKQMCPFEMQWDNFSNIDMI